MPLVTTERMTCLVQAHLILINRRGDLSQTFDFDSFWVRVQPELIPMREGRR